MLLQVDNEDMTNTKVHNLMVVNPMVIWIQGDCRPVTLHACYFDILMAFEGKFWLELPNLVILAKTCLQMPSKCQNVKVTGLQCYRPAVTLDQNNHQVDNHQVVCSGVGHVLVFNLK